MTDAELALSRTWYDAGCWRVRGSGWRSGHARVRGRSASRAVYVELVGPIEPGLELDHRCRTTDCVNPLHLEPVSRAENIRRGIETAPAWQRAKTHCPKGHVLDGVRTKPHYSRYCKTCSRAGAKARYQADRGERSSY